MFMNYRLHSIKIAILPKLIYKFSAIPIRIPAYFLAEIDKLTLKFKWKLWGSRIATKLLKKKQNWKTCMSQFKNLHNMAIKTVGYWPKYTDQWNRIESPEINLCTMGN